MLIIFLIGGLIGFAAGVMTTRNLNWKDSQFWFQQGYEQARQKQDHESSSG